MSVTNLNIIQAIEHVAPRHLQEGYDNTGLQCGSHNASCSGVLLCVDVTDHIVDEAIKLGCNLIITHHPLLFHPIKSITGCGRIQKALVNAIKNNITIYSCHTAIDNAPQGISHAMASKLKLNDVTILEDREDNELGKVGCGIIGTLQTPVSRHRFIEIVKEAFNSPVTRCSNPDQHNTGEIIHRVALCGGSGSFLIDRAIQLNADVFITSDTKYNYFIDYAEQIFLVDIGHYESEECAKEIFYHIITKKFPNFAVYKSQTEQNPIKYL